MRKIQNKAVMENFDAFLDFIDSCINETGFDKVIINKIRLACEEIIINIIKYAYPETKGDMTIHYRITKPACIHITFIDQGVSFNPLEIVEPDIDAPIQERQIGGLGIFIVKKVMDEVVYERIKGKNVLTIKKCPGEDHG